MPDSICQVRTPRGKGPRGRKAKSIKAKANYDHNQVPKRNPRSRPLTAPAERARPTTVQKGHK